jgi:hypothetical protein
MNAKDILTQYGTADCWTNVTFTGPDACLEESLFAYGIVWTSEPDANGDIRFVYRTYTEPDQETIHTSWAAINVTVDPEREWDWVDWNDFCNGLGVTYADWLGQPFGMRVADLVLHYGHENIFGTTYDPKVTVEQND